MSLDADQARVLSEFSKGSSVAIIGGAGSGKSFLLKQILSDAHTRFGGFPIVAACALTNQAALSFEGTTIHSLFGAPPHWKFSKEELIRIVRKNSRKQNLLRKIRVLIIDEISLLTAEVLDSIDAVLRDLAPTDMDSSLPLGGRQLVVAGDPFQLEAIGVMEPGCRIFESAFTFFSSMTWLLSFGGLGSGIVAILSRNHRQSSDTEFFNVLQRIRYGKHREEDLIRINNTGNVLHRTPRLFTKLCLHRTEVQRVNKHVLISLPGEMYSNEAEDTFFAKHTEHLRRRLNQAADPTIFVKVGCDVLITGKVGIFCPGTRAKVVSVFNSFQCSKIKSMKLLFQDGNCEIISQRTCAIRSGDTTILACRKQFPIIPAYAVTVHRSQGLTLNNVDIDFKSVRDWKPHGMVYVVLSRCTSFTGLSVTGLSSNHISVSHHARIFMEKLSALHKHSPDRVIGWIEDTPSPRKHTGKNSSFPETFRLKRPFDHLNAKTYISDFTKSKRYRNT